MDIQIRLSGESAPADLDDLLMWLDHEEELRGRATVGDLAVRPGEMGGFADALAVALGAQGAVVVLASALSTWIKHRRPSAAIEISRDGGPSVKISLRDADPETVDAVVRRALDP